MAQYLYCGTDAKVAAAKTAELLLRADAIWCPPPGLRPDLWNVGVQPTGGEHLFLAWRGAGAGPVLLGVGTIMAAPETLFNCTVLWTNPLLPGVVDVAHDCGYDGPTSMAFLRLAEPVVLVAPFPEMRFLRRCHAGFNLLTDQEAAQCMAVLQNSPRGSAT